MRLLRPGALGCALLCTTSAAPAAFAQALPGDVFVSEYATGSVLNIRGGGDLGAAVRFATGLEGPRGVCVGPEGEIFVAEQDSGEVTNITLGGDFTGFGAHASGLGGPMDLLCNEELILVVESTEGSGEITDVTDGGDFTGAPSVAAGLGTPTALMLDVDDENGTFRIFASDTAGARLFDVTGGGVFLAVPPFASNGTTPLGMADFGDAILVADAGTGQVLDFTAGGDLQLAPVFATLPGVVNVRNVPGLGLFAISDAQDAVFDVSAGGDFTAATPFASGVAADGFAGFAHVRGCGDGILEAGDEDCDDGNVLDGDGCNSSCRVRLCLDPPAPDCRVARRGSLTYKGKKEGREKLKVSMAGFDVASTQADFGVPTFDTTRYDICIYDDDESLVANLIVARGFDTCGPKDQSCWVPVQDKGYKYKDPSAESAGIRAIQGVGGKAGQGKLAVQGSNKSKKNQNRLPRNIDNQLEGSTSARVQVMVSDASCFDVQLPIVKKNESEHFVGKTP